MGTGTGRVQNREPHQPLKTRSRDDLLSVAVVAAVVLVDQLTKNWALDHYLFRPRHIVWTLELTVAHNTGTAFSLLSGKGVGPVVALLAIVVIAVVARSMRGVSGRSTAIAVGLVVGGAIGNLGDRAFRSHSGFLQGAVVDWINFQWWPVFNAADSAIVVGAVMLAVVAVRTPPEKDDVEVGVDAP